jgi:hypothetical protein
MRNVVHCRNEDYFNRTSFVSPYISSRTSSATSNMAANDEETDTFVYDEGDWTDAQMGEALRRLDEMHRQVSQRVRELFLEI